MSDAVTVPLSQPPRLELLHDDPMPNRRHRNGPIRGRSRSAVEGEPQEDHVISGCCQEVMRSSRRRDGTRQATAATVTSVIVPPKTTDGTTPRSRAATPLSNAPS